MVVPLASVAVPFTVSVLLAPNETVLVALRLLTVIETAVVLLLMDNVFPRLVLPVTVRLPPVTAKAELALVVMLLTVEVSPENVTVPAEVMLTTTSSPAAGTPEGLQAEAVFQLPLLAGTHVFVTAWAGRKRPPVAMIAIVTSIPARLVNLRRATGSGAVGWGQLARGGRFLNVSMASYFKLALLGTRIRL
jgi:hypothetical protein